MEEGEGAGEKYPDFECAGLEELVAPQVESYDVDVQCKACGDPSPRARPIFKTAKTRQLVLCPVGWKHWTTPPPPRPDKMPQTLLTPRAPTTGFLRQFSQLRIKDEAIRSYLLEVGAYSTRQAARLPRRPNSHDGFFLFQVDPKIPSSNRGSGWQAAKMLTCSQFPAR